MSDTLVVETADIGVLELPFVAVDYEAANDGKDDRRACRVFTMPQVDGDEFETFATTVLLDQWAEGEDGSDYRELQLLVWLYVLVPNKDRRKVRQFDATTFERCESLRALAAATRTKNATLPERLLVIAGGGGARDVALFDGAAYERPVIQLPLADEEYEQFREHALGELAATRDQFERLVLETVAEIVQERTEGSGAPCVAKATEEAFDDVKFWNGAGKVIRKAMAQVLAETEKREERHAARFGDVVARIDEIRSGLAEQIERRGVKTTVECEDGGATVTAEFVAILEETLPAATADELLRELLRRVEQDHHLTPLCVVDEDEFPAATGTVDDVAAPNESCDTEFSVYEQYQQALTLAIAAGDVFEKWSALCQIRAQFVNRMECMRLLHREGELAYSTAYGLAAKLVYQRVRPHLSRDERRAFQLLYLPSRWLNGRVAALEPLAWSFALGMDDGTRNLLYSVLVRKTGDATSRDELGRRWNAFLRFYPHWLDMVRDDEREDRRRRSDRKPTASFADHMLRDTKAAPPEMGLQFAAVLSERLPEWSARYCTPTQAKYLLAYYRDGLTEAAIGRENGVTQQAVNKCIGDALKRLRVGLRNDRIAEFEDSRL